MARKIITVTLIVISSIMLGLSIAGIATVWIYKEPLKNLTATRLKEIDVELAQAQTTLQNAKVELERTMRIVDSAEKTPSIPNLKPSKPKIGQFRSL